MMTCTLLKTSILTRRLLLIKRLDTESSEIDESLSLDHCSIDLGTGLMKCT